MRRPRRNTHLKFARMRCRWYSSIRGASFAVDGDQTDLGQDQLHGGKIQISGIHAPDTITRQVRPDSGEDMDPTGSFACCPREIISSPTSGERLLGGMVFSSA